jgi:hypothetical protein
MTTSIYVPVPIWRCRPHHVISYVYYPRRIGPASTTFRAGFGEYDADVEFGVDDLVLQQILPASPPGVQPWGPPSSLWGCRIDPRSSS